MNKDAMILKKILLLKPGKHTYAVCCLYTLHDQYKKYISGKHIMTMELLLYITLLAD